MPKTRERRAPDQDEALESAFLAGSLPEEDRRAEPAMEPVPETPEPVTPVPVVTEAPSDVGAMFYRDNSR